MVDDGTVRRDCSFEVTNSMGNVLSEMVSMLSKTLTKDYATQSWRLTDEKGHSIKLTDGTDPNKISKNGQYITWTNLNVPFGAWWMINHYSSFGPGHGYQTAINQDFSTSMYFRFQLAYKWTPWIKVNGDEPVRLWEGSLTDINVDINLKDNICNYKYIIINTGNVSGGKNTSLVIYPFAYLKGNIRPEEEMYTTIIINGTIYQLYFKPSNGGMSLYMELRNSSGTKITSNPDTVRLVLRYIVGVK